MYKFATNDMIFEGVSILFGGVIIATAFLAVITAFYCINLLKDDEKQAVQEVGGDMAVEEDDILEDEIEEDDILEDEDDQYLANDSPTESELEIHYNQKDQIHRHLMDEDEADDYDCNSDSDDDDDDVDEDMENEIVRDCHIKRNDSAKKENNVDDDKEQSLVDGLVSKMKTNRLKELEAQLTRDQLEEERRIEREQLAAIFELLKKQEAELNMKEIDESELNAQLGLYR